MFVSLVFVRLLFVHTSLRTGERTHTRSYTLTDTEREEGERGRGRHQFLDGIDFDDIFFLRHHLLPITDNQTAFAREVHENPRKDEMR